jgi:hypothetical protein
MISNCLARNDRIAIVLASRYCFGGGVMDHAADETHHRPLRTGVECYLKVSRFYQQAIVPLTAR